MKMIRDPQEGPERSSVHEKIPTGGLVAGRRSPQKIPTGGLVAGRRSRRSRPGVFSWKIPTWKIPTWKIPTGGLLLNDPGYRDRQVRYAAQHGHVSAIRKILTGGLVAE